MQGLTLSTTDGLLLSSLKHCGRIEEARVCRTQDGESRGFAFVLFAEAGAAAMAVREGGVRIDGKLCQARLARPREELAGSEHMSAGGAAHEIQTFITRHEISGRLRSCLLRADPMIALRVVRSIESCNKGFSEALVHAELQKLASTQLDPEMEARVRDWAWDLDLSSDFYERIVGMLLAQRPDEIEHALLLGQTAHFRSELRKKDNPVGWLFAKVQHYRRRQTLGDIEAFCQRFGFDSTTEQQLGELSAERARRLMQGWQPAGPGTQRDRQNGFLVLLNQALKERKNFQQDHKQGHMSAVASHARIIEEWSDGEDGEEGQENWDPEPESAQNVLYTFDTTDWESQDDVGSAQGRAGKSNGAERFVIHTAQSGVERYVIHSTAQMKTSTTQMSGVSVQKQRSHQPKPTHFILCVDTSGSMVIPDCRNSSGGTVTRLRAVLDTCHEFVTFSALHQEDVYSFVTFDEETEVHFSCRRAVDAAVALEQLCPSPKRQTLYAMGIRGVEAAIKRDNRRLPAHVVFLSDGEPTDPTAYIRDLMVLRRRHPGDALKIYTVGFGESAKVSEHEDDFQYLQQLASLGRGHFQRCGASLASLQGAFTAVTSTITRSRTSMGRRSRSTLDRSAGDRESSQLLPGSATGVPSVTQEPFLPNTIAEEMANAISSSESECDARNAPMPWLSNQRNNTIEFELPHPRNIFKDLANRDLWKDFMAAQTSFKFDGHRFSRSAAVQRVWLRRKPFMQGGMRLVYGMVLEAGKHAPDSMEHMMCAKRLFQDLEKDRGFGAHVAFCKSTAVAHYFARQFRTATEKVGDRAQFGFLDCQLYSPVGEGEDGYHFCGEAWLKGHFVKLNSNAGFVNEIDYSEHSAIAQAFSHFTFDRSHGELLVVDLQGICGGEGDSPYFLLTDPQVHSRGAFERFGAGDLGERGISAFFQKHHCGELCQKLKLRKEYDLRAPTHLLPMPGVQDCIKYMLGTDGKDFFRQLRQNCRLSSLALPREAHSEWLDIRLWATERGGQRAVKLLQERLDSYYHWAREVVRVEQEPPWDSEQWRSQLESWRRESGASLVAYPPDWHVTSRVQEVWVFAEGKQSQKARAYACQRVREALRHAHDEESKQVVQQQSSQVAWKQYQDVGGSKFWYREPDGLWFWESDPQWQRFLDDASHRHWWWNKETGLWFYEP